MWHSEDKGLIHKGIHTAWTYSICVVWHKTYSDTFTEQRDKEQNYTDAIQLIHSYLNYHNRCHQDHSVEGQISARKAEAVATFGLLGTYMRARASPKCGEGKGGGHEEKWDVWMRVEEVRVRCAAGAQNEKDRMRVSGQL